MNGMVLKNEIAYGRIEDKETKKMSTACWQTELDGCLLLLRNCRQEVSYVKQDDVRIVCKVSQQLSKLSKIGRTVRISSCPALSAVRA